ncbi:MAG: DegT/DnrJ/EryC1/StrS family aminotransferase [Candidatus Thorarchaeota archaeon]|nr:DegT/DnrJ/EryC1/StrS family aminotransferase [Candidatus Thorarchaeota archaeon]
MIPLARPVFDKADLKAVEEVLHSGWVAGQGPRNVVLSEKFSEYLGVKHSVPMVNCTAALHLALLSLGIGKDDEVLVSDFTFPATGHSVLYVGGQPIFVDAELDSYNLSLEDIESKISERTKAIIAVHAFGNPVDMDELLKLSHEYCIPVIEDAACAAGSIYHGHHVGTFGAIGCFSLHARKILTTGEGGIFVTNDDKLATKAKSLANFGIRSAYQREQGDDLLIPEFVEVGYNYKLSDIAAGLAISRLDKLKASIDRRNEVARVYDDLFENTDCILVQQTLQNSTHSYQSYVVTLETSKTRSIVYSKMKENGIQTQIGTYSSVCQPVYGRNQSECPNSVKLFNQTLAIPIFDTITDDEIHKVAAALKKAVTEI